ncbi:conserved protein of unknown function [Pseudomonas marincola]|uniref:Uncharacterized protein n=1 Tax=Pseudomonas marincola TaxID=437900 RepID=A0A653E6W6_9PSED|nr:conserved protein of unknown function [Pseudomonas marincola]
MSIILWLPHSFSWHASYSYIIRNITNDRRTGANHHALADPNKLSHTSANTDPTEVTYMHTTSKPCAGANMYRRAQDTIMFNATTRIENAPLSDTCISIHHRSGKYHRPLSNSGITTHHGGRMDESSQVSSSFT